MTLPAIPIPSHPVKRAALEAGFDIARVSAALDMHLERARYLEWVRAGRQGEMRWMTEERAVRSTSPRAVVEDVRSVISVGLAYWHGARPHEGRATGHIARYAWGRDYHTVMGDRLRRLAESLELEYGSSGRWYVDTGPVMDKALAVRAGLGWYGKNTNVLTDQFGSWVLLGEILTTLAIEPDPPESRDCGSCRLCLIACPTGALGPEYSIDSRKCISYLTIEHRGPIPRELRPLMGSWVFGCDICQDVCPPAMAPYLTTPSERRSWAARLRGTVQGAPHDGAPEAPVSATPTAGHALFGDRIRPSVDLLWLLTLSHEDYVGTFRGSAIKRAKVWMLRRNAAVAVGNTGLPEHTEPLAHALRTDAHPVVRGHAAWGLGRLAERHSLDVSGPLRSALAAESDTGVLEEINAALSCSGVELR